MSKRRLLEHVNWTLIGIIGALVVIGLINLYSAVYFWGAGSDAPHTQFWSQFIWTFAGFALMFGISFIDYRLTAAVAIPLYIFVCLLIISSILMGDAIRGTHGWLKLGPISLQPAELAKLSYILVAARFFSRNTTTGGYTLLELWQPLLLMVIPFGLIILQGDMGSSLFLICIFASLALFAGMHKKTLIVCILIATFAGGIAYTYGLKDYQRDRILNFMNPEADMKHKGYHLVQSKIAVGSGRLFGRGYMKGNINKLEYLPERHTDFIFPVFAEEWGFVGSIVMLCLYAALMLLGVDVAARSRDRYGTFIAIGVIALLFWQMVINLGGVLGLMPLTGVTLPLMSYGGSSMIAILLSLGLLLSIHMRRFIF